MRNLFHLGGTSLPRSHYWYSLKWRKVFGYESILIRCSRAVSQLALAMKEWQGTAGFPVRFYLDFTQILPLSSVRLPKRCDAKWVINLRLARLLRYITRIASHTSGPMHDLQEGYPKCSKIGILFKEIVK